MLRWFLKENFHRKTNWFPLLSFFLFWDFYFSQSCLLKHSRKFSLSLHSMIFFHSLEANISIKFHFISFQWDFYRILMEHSKWLNCEAWDDSYWSNLGWKMLLRNFKNFFKTFKVIQEGLNFLILLDLQIYNEINQEERLHWAEVRETQLTINHDEGVGRKVTFMDKKLLAFHVR